MNDDMELHCTRSHCTGVVMEYDTSGCREAPDEVYDNQLTVPRAIIRFIYVALGWDVQPLKWYECSLCGKHHPEYSDK